MDEYIILADETIVQNAYVVGMGGDRIAVYVNGTHTFMEMYGWFGSAEKTVSMTSHQYLDVQEWEGYTTPVAMQIDNGYSHVVLVK